MSMDGGKAAKALVTVTGKSASPLCRLFITHPELNASAIARRLGIQQSILAAYASGTKKPSAQRERMILEEIRKVGRELAAV